MTLEEAKKYCQEIDEMTVEEKILNHRSVAQAMELSSWIYDAENGSPDHQKIALKVLKGYR